MNGQKKFVNHTGIDLSVMLQVRKGSNPSSNLDTKDLSLATSEEKMFQYGNDANPFLNGIALNGRMAGSFMAEQMFVFSRGGDLDDELNKHDTIIFKLKNSNFTIDFSNTWA